MLPRYTEVSLPLIFAKILNLFLNVADVAQLVEHRIVTPVVAGSIPVIRPTSPFINSE